MFEEEAKEYCTQQEFSKDVRDNIYNAFKDGAEFGFQKGITISQLFQIAPLYGTKWLTKIYRRKIYE